jgi:hypothetical protein
LAVSVGKKSKTGTSTDESGRKLEEKFGQLAADFVEKLFRSRFHLFEKCLFVCW